MDGHDPEDGRDEVEGSEVRREEAKGRILDQMDGEREELRLC